MKKLIFSLALTIFMIGCSKDDDKNSVSNEDLIGTWVLTSSETTVKVMGKSVTEADELDPDLKEKFTFKNDGSYIRFEEKLGKPGYSESGNYELSGDKLSLTSDEEITTITCQIKGGNKLILTDESTIMGFEEKWVGTYTKE